MVFRVIAPLSAARFRQLWADKSLTKDTLPAVAGCSYDTLQKRAVAMGLPPRSPGRAKLGGLLFAEMWRAGVSATEMAAHFGASQTGVTRAALRLGLPGRGAGTQPLIGLSAFLELRLLRRMAVDRATEVARKPAAPAPIMVAKSAPVREVAHV